MGIGGPDWVRVGQGQRGSQQLVGPQFFLPQPEATVQNPASLEPSAPSSDDPQEVLQQHHESEPQSALPHAQVKTMKITIDPNVTTNICVLPISVKCGLPLGAILDQLSEIVKTDRRKLVLVATPASTQTLSIWEPCPDAARLVDIMSRPTPTRDTLHVDLPPTDISFILCVDRRRTNEDIVQRLAILMATHPSDVRLVDSSGYPWTHPPQNQDCHVKVVKEH